MQWKLPATILLGAACLGAVVLALPLIGVKISVDVLPVQTLCQPIRLSIALSNGRPALSVNGQRTTETRLLDDLSETRGICLPQSTPIYIYADRSLKFGDCTRLDDQLKKAGYEKIYLQMVDHPAT